MLDMLYTVYELAPGSCTPHKRALFFTRLIRTQSMSQRAPLITPGNMRTVCPQGHGYV